MRNYFNYFTEVEEHFAKRREKHLLVSPLDWCLIELWKSNDIPLHVALRGIDRSFESAAKRKRRPPTTLFYCHPAVIEAFEEYCESRVGSGEAEKEGAESPVSRAQVLACLDRLRETIADRPGEVFERVRQGLLALAEETRNATAVPAEEIDRELDRFGRIVAEGLWAELGREEAKDLRKSVRSELKLYRKRLSKEMYSKLEENYLARELRRRNGLPEFSLLTATE